MMTDILDKAKELEEKQLQAVLNNRVKMQSVSELNCIDCDLRIPEKRHAIGGIKRCLLCQIEEEKRVKVHG